MVLLPFAVTSKNLQECLQSYFLSEEHPDAIDCEGGVRTVSRKEPPPKKKILVDGLTLPPGLVAQRRQCPPSHPSAASSPTLLFGAADCDQRTIHIRAQRMKSFPSLLVLQLNHHTKLRRDRTGCTRPQVSAEAGASSNTFNVPSTLDQSDFEAVEDPAAEVYHYKLCAIISHHGASSNHGHYTATIKRSEVWYNADDDKVTKLTNFEPGKLRKLPCLLFYERHTGHSSSSTEAAVAKSAEKAEAVSRTTMCHAVPTRTTAVLTCVPAAVVTRPR